MMNKFGGQCDTVNKMNGDLTSFVHPLNEWIADFIAY